MYPHMTSREATLCALDRSRFVDDVINNGDSDGYPWLRLSHWTLFSFFSMELFMALLSMLWPSNQGSRSFEVIFLGWLIRPRLR